jgi:hypothetical protein
VRASEALLDEVTVDGPLAAIADEVVADEVVAAGVAFTLLFTKRCSLAS